MADTTRNAQHQETANLFAVLKENDLTLRETGFFRGKETVHRVMDRHENRFILKTGGIDPMQVELFRAAKRRESDLCFKVPLVVKTGKGWMLLEEVKGKPLNDFYDEKPDWCVEISKNIADSYQTVLKEVHPKKDVLTEGERWLFSRLSLWSKPIVDAGLIDFSVVQKIKRNFEEVIKKKGADLFGWCHGNIIGDHIFVSGDDLYLLDLNAVPRAGRGYYDFLRALDFLFLKTRREGEMFASTPKWIKRHLSDFDEDEVRLVFAFRMIGILGWDILHHRVEYVTGSVEKKKEAMVKYIKMGQ